MNLPPEEYWEARWQSGDTPWDKGRAHPALEEWLRAARFPKDSSVLVPGCGAGHDVRAWSRAGGQAWGLDISETAIYDARRQSIGEKYQLGSLFSPPSSWLETFDFVFEHTCFCAIDPKFRPEYAKSVTSLLRPGGKMVAVFYLNPDHDEDGPPYRTSQEELELLFQPTFNLLSSQVPRATFPGREGRESFQIWEKRDDGPERKP